MILQLNRLVVWFGVPIARNSFNRQCCICMESVLYCSLHVPACKPPLFQIYLGQTRPKGQVMPTVGGSDLIGKAVRETTCACLSIKIRKRNICVASTSVVIQFIQVLALTLT